jgi:hypothetical protein
LLIQFIVFTFLVVILAAAAAVATVSGNLITYNIVSLTTRSQTLGVVIDNIDLHQAINTLSFKRTVARLYNLKISLVEQPPKNQKTL